MNCSLVPWAAGLLEGEGCISIFKSKGRNQVTLLCEMNDLDVLEKLQLVLGAGKISSRGTRRGKRKESFIYAIYKKDDLRNILRTIQPYMGKRRSEKIEAALEILH